MTDDGELIGSYLVRVHLRATDTSAVKIPTLATLESLISEVLEMNSVEPGTGNYTVRASVTAERIDK